MLRVAAVCLWELRVPQLRYRMPTPKSTAMIQRDRVKGTCSTFALHSLIWLQNDFFFMLSTCLLSPLVLHHIPCNYITLPLSLCQEFAKDLQNPHSWLFTCLVQHFCLSPESNSAIASFCWAKLCKLHRLNCCIMVDQLFLIVCHLLHRICVHLRVLCV